MLEIIFRNDLDEFCDLQNSFAKKGIPETHKKHKWNTLTT